MHSRCPCGIVIVWPANICPQCRKPTTAEQRQKAAPKPLTPDELADLEADTLRHNRSNKVYHTKTVWRLIMTIRQLQKDQAKPSPKPLRPAPAKRKKPTPAPLQKTLFK